MSTRINFHKEAKIAGGTVEVGGESEVINADAKLVTRYVALQQGTEMVSGPATTDVDWKSSPPLDATKFTKGKALAIATETHVMGPPQNPGPSTAFVTVTWSQIIELTT
jgi:hypothetical protein